MYPIYKIKLHDPTMHKPQSDASTWQRKEIGSELNKFAPPIVHVVRIYKLSDLSKIFPVYNL